MILYSTNSIKNVEGTTTNLEASGPEQNELLVLDKESHSYFSDVLDQLKITNYHLSLLTDSIISNGDIEG
jgi:hypothetical protein